MRKFVHNRNSMFKLMWFLASVSLWVLFICDFQYFTTQTNTGVLYSHVFARYCCCRSIFFWHTPSCSCYIIVSNTIQCLFQSLIQRGGRAGAKETIPQWAMRGNERRKTRGTTNVLSSFFFSSVILSRWDCYFWCNPTPLCLHTDTYTKRKK